MGYSEFDFFYLLSMLAALALLVLISIFWFIFLAKGLKKREGKRKVFRTICKVIGVTVKIQGMLVFFMLGFFSYILVVYGLTFLMHLISTN